MSDELNTPYPANLPVELRQLWDLSADVHHGDAVAFREWLQKLVEYKQFWDIVRPTR